MTALFMIWLIASLWIPGSIQTPPPDDQTNACPVIVRTAITLTNQRCEDTGLNQVCYGHLVLDAQPRVGLTNFGFTEPGDIVNVVDVQSLRLSALDASTGGWGVVMMQIEANLVQAAETAPEVQIILFGDAELNDATSFLPGEVLQTAQVRRAPASTAEILTELEAGDPVTASGRISDSSWLRINLSGTAGWLPAEAVILNGDINSLSAIPPDADTGSDTLAQFGPMQAFYFRSGADDAPCAEAPNSGLLIQTPEGVAALSIWMDEVVIQLDATAFIQAQPDGTLSIRVLDGTARVTAEGETRTAASGMQIEVPLDNQLGPTSAPGDPVPYDPEAVQSLPVQLLNRPVDVPAPRSHPANVPLEGQWQFNWDTAQLTCPDGTIVPFESTGAASSIEVTGETLLWNAARYTQSTPGIYRSSYVDSSGNLHQDTLQVIAPDRIVGEKTLDLNSQSCTLNVGFLLQLVSAAE